MPSLTIDLIRDNPWTLLTHTLPSEPSPILIEVAYLAAEYCCRSEYLLMMAAREGSYIPSGWEPTAECCDVHEESEARFLDAERVFEEISDNYEVESED